MSAPAWGDQGRVRGWFHTKAGARFLNAQTAWFRLRSPKGFAILETTGRRSGAHRSSCVRAVIEGDRAYLVAIGGPSTAWLQNASAQADVTLRTGRRRRSAIAREIVDEQERVDAETAFVTSVFPFDRMSAVINQRGAPARRHIRSMHQRWFDHGTPVVLELGDADRVRRARR